MFKSILKIKPIFRASSTVNRYLRGNKCEEQQPISDASSVVKTKKVNLIEEWAETSELPDSFMPKTFNPEKRKELFNELNQDLKGDHRIKKMYQYYNDDIVMGVNSSKSVTSLLNFLEPQMSQVRPDQLECIIEKLVSLVLVDKKVDPSNFWKSIRSVRELPAFQSLLKRMIKLIRELDSRCLVAQLSMLNLFNQDTSTKIMVVTLEMLKHKINDLELDEIGQCLTTSYFIKGKHLENFMFTFRHALVHVAKIRIMSNRFDVEDASMAIAFMKIFLSSDFVSNTNVQLRLVQVLLQPKIEFNYMQAVRVLSVLNQLPKLEANPKSEKLMQRLVKKCNATIYEKFSLESSPNELAYYLKKVHLRPNLLLAQNPCFSNFHTYPMMNLLSPSLIQNFEQYDKQLIFNLLHNYSKFNVYNEMLLEKMYQEFDSNFELRSNINMIFVYDLYSHLKLPFVNHEHFTSKLFDLNNFKVQDTISFRSNSIKLLAELVLNGIRNENLLNFVIKSTSYLNKGNLKSLDIPHLNKLILAQLYLSMFTVIDSALRKTIGNKLKELKTLALAIHDLPTIDTEYSQFSDKIQKNAFLSNGLYLNQIAIYDRSTQELLSLNNFRHYFHKIEKVPLTEHQELLTFIERSRPQGQIKEYESNYNVCLKKVLREMSIKTIDVCPDDYLNLPTKNRVEYLIQSVASSYGVSK